jgi:hypothetical protein
LDDDNNTVMETETTKAGNAILYYNRVVPTLQPEPAQLVLVQASVPANPEPSSSLANDELEQEVSDNYFDN